MTREGLRIRKTSKLAAAAASVIACVLCLGLVSAAQAAPGDLDPTFSGDGTVLTDFGGNDGASDVVLQSDGKIVVVGSTGYDFAIARYNADGSPDTGFDGDGRQTTTLGSAYGVALQPDGKIVAVGGTGSDFALARYNTDGSLDTSFSGDGKQVTDFGSPDVGDTDDRAFDVAVQEDGKIVVVGYAGYAENYAFALARYNADGSLDGSFSGDGREMTSMGGDSQAYAVALRSDGKIVVAGYGDGGFWGTYAFAVARYNPDGSLDSSFSGGGVLTDMGWSDLAYGVALQPDGKIVAAGVGDFAWKLARYNADGSLDTSFGQGGRQATVFGGHDWATDVAIQPDGAIVVVGYGGSAWMPSVFALARYTADGWLDPSFSGDGVLTTGFGANSSATGVALQPDGRIVVVGGIGNDFAVIRYEGRTGPDTAAPETSITDGPTGTTGEGTPTFGFASNEVGSTFACRVDASAFAPCSSPHTTATLSDGPHTFEVRATDPAGNVDASPAGRAFTVDTASPSVTVTAPASGATLTGIVSVAADALDNLAVAGVQFTLDGTSLGLEDTLAPYAVTWDTRTSGNGPHVLSALARDAAGNPATATSVSVSVDNDESSPTVPTNLSAVPVSSSQIDVSWSAATDNVGVAGYRVTRNGAVVTTTSATSFKDAGLAASTTYTYSVTAFDAAGNVSSASAPLSATTPAPPTAGLAAAYRFGEGAGTTTADGSPNANNGALVNGAAWTSGGRFGSAINFDGVNDHVRVADSASLDLGRTGTVEAWVKLDTLNRWHGVVAKGNTNQDQSHNYALEIGPSNRWLCILGSGTARVVVQSSTSARTNQFTHVACVWNGTTVQLYLDGVLNASAAQSITPAANNSPLYIGQFGGNADRLDGIVDEVRIYNRALTQAEIQSDMNTPIAA